MITINTLADLKRVIAVSGTVITVTHNDGWAHWRLDDPKVIARKEAQIRGRKVAKLQTNGIKFDDGSWLYWGKAEEWIFHGDNTATFRPKNSNTNIRYKFLVPHSL